MSTCCLPPTLLPSVPYVSPAAATPLLPQNPPPRSALPPHTRSLTATAAASTSPSRRPPLSGAAAAAHTAGSPLASSSSSTVSCARRLRWAWRQWRQTEGREQRLGRIGEDRGGGVRGFCTRQSFSPSAAPTHACGDAGPCAFTKLTYHTHPPTHPPTHTHPHALPPPAHPSPLNSTARCAPQPPPRAQSSGLGAAQSTSGAATAASTLPCSMAWVTGRTCAGWEEAASGAGVVWWVGCIVAAWSQKH